jgi:hypothetical protein
LTLKWRVVKKKKKEKRRDGLEDKGGTMEKESLGQYRAESRAELD